MQTGFQSNLTIRDNLYTHESEPVMNIKFHFISVQKRESTVSRVTISTSDKSEDRFIKICLISFQSTNGREQKK